MQMTRKVLGLVVVAAGTTIFIVGSAEATPRRDVVAVAPSVELLQMPVASENDLALVQTQLKMAPHIQPADVSPTATMPMVATTTRWRYGLMQSAENTNKVTATKVTTTTSPALLAPPTKTAASSLTNFPLVEDSS